MSKSKTLIIFTILIQLSWAGITFSGNAALRPRFDHKTFGDYPKDGILNSSGDSYILYRGRIRMIADIGEGWFFNAKLSTNARANYNRLGKGDKLDDSNPDGSGRSSIYFMEMFWCYHKKNTGAWVGIIPVNGINNPGLDIHYYPKLMVNIPWVLYNNNATTGFGGYYVFNNEKINWTLSIDNDVTNYEEPVGSDKISRLDNITVMVDYQFHFDDFSVKPIMLLTIADDDEATPTTAGVQVKIPGISKFSLSGNAYFTSQSNSDAPDGKYEGWLVRGKASRKIGKGTLTFWLDVAEMDWDMEDTHTFTFFWGHYLIPVYSSDFGSVTVRPTFRYLNEAVDGIMDVSLYRFEITTEIKFK